MTRFESISTRKLSKALQILSADKTMVAMSDYDDYHKTVKKNVLTSILGPAARVGAHNAKIVVKGLFLHLVYNILTNHHC